MAGTLTFDQLKEAVTVTGKIDTVVACFPDMQGRLIGKRFQAEFFLGGAHEETHGCDYLLADDIDMEPVPGYAVASWERGYGDFIMKPDLATLRRIPFDAARENADDRKRYGEIRELAHPPGEFLGIAHPVEDFDVFLLVGFCVLAAPRPHPAA